jgi:hypothetical protein
LHRSAAGVQEHLWGVIVWCKAYQVREATRIPREKAKHQIELQHTAGHEQV